MHIYRLSQQTDFIQSLFIPLEDLIEEHGDYIPESIMKEWLSTNNVAYEVYDDLLIVNNIKRYYFELSVDEYTTVNICEYIERMSECDMMEVLRITDEQLYNPYTESYAKDHPSHVYHFTTPEAWEQIQESGYLKPSYGTGINNRSDFGVFTTIDPEEYADGTYGDIVLEIDLESLRQDMMKFNPDNDIDVQPESEVKEHLLRETVAHKFNAPCEFESPSDISGNTLTINARIPLQYVKELT